MDSDTSEPEMRSDNSSVAKNFWKSLSDSRIDCTCEAPAPRQYSSTTISSIEALDKETEALQGALHDIQLRCTNETHALDSVLNTLHKRQAAAEREIARSIATIHHHRNALIPIARLPPEILARVLVLNAQMEPQDWRLDAAATSIRVCKWWRQVGLGCPELWSYIRCTSYCSAAWMEKVMERACAVPLSLAVSSYPDPGMDVVGVVAKNLHRCRSLSLHPFWHFHLFQPFKKFNQQTPLLQRLEIKSFHRGEGFTFPADFLDGRAPNLRHVQIKAYSYIPWHATLFANLVSLKVDTAVEPDGPKKSSVGMLLSALARMSTLEVLSLHNCFPYPTPSTMVVTHAHLPNLKLFRITGTLGDCTRFLKQITTNATAVIRVDIRDSDIFQADIEEFFAVFPSQLCTTFPPITQALQFTWRDGGELGVDARTVQPGTALENSFHVSFKPNPIQSWGISPLDLMWPCFVALASPQLRSFRILGGDVEGWDVEVWRKLAYVAPGLQRLSPGKGALSAELCKTLRPPSEPDLILADCCLPELSYLELEVPCDLPMLTPEGGETLLSALLADSLAVRAMIDCPTPELVFSVPCERSPQGWSELFGDAVPGIAVRQGRGEPVMMSRIGEYRTLRG